MRTFVISLMSIIAFLLLTVIAAAVTDVPEGQCESFIGFQINGIKIGATQYANDC